MNKYFEISGKVIFDPVNLTKKHKKQSSWKKNILVLIDDIDLCKYYCWFVKKRYNLELQLPQRGLHFTIVNDKVSDERKYLHAKKNYNGETITIKYYHTVRTDNIHWWVRAECKQAEEIRKACGLPQNPYWGFHLSIGRADGDLRIQHSKYIHELITKYGKEYE